MLRIFLPVYASVAPTGNTRLDERLTQLSDTGVSDNDLFMDLSVTETLELRNLLKRLSHVLEIGYYEDDTLFAYRMPLTHAPEQDPFQPDMPLSLAPHAHIRRDENGILLESPGACARILLHHPDALTYVNDLMFGQPDSVPLLFLQFLYDAGLLYVDTSPHPAEDWYFKDAVFYFNPPAPVPVSHNHPAPPVTAPALSDDILDLPRPEHTLDLTDALEKRRSVRTHGVRPISLGALGIFLYHSSRIQARVRYDGYIATWRPYPSGGALHELEIYLAVNHCDGLDYGLYHYQPERHALEVLPGDPAPLIKDAIKKIDQETEDPHIILLVSARFARNRHKYGDRALSVTLKNVGGLFQTWYLVAAGMDLAACAINDLKPGSLAQITGLSREDEDQVGAFLLGLP